MDYHGVWMCDYLLIFDVVWAYMKSNEKELSNRRKKKEENDELWKKKRNEIIEGI